MRGLVTAVFYIWLVGSVIGLVLYRRHKASAASAATPSTDGGGPVGAARVAVPPPGAAPATPPPADPGRLDRGPAAPAPHTTLPGATGSAGPVDPGPPPAGAGPGSGAVSSARRGLFAADPDAPTPAATIAEALRDVDWPCGLTPVVVLDDLHQADRRVVFSTTEAAAPVVGARVGDALEAAGFEITSLDDANALARRPGATVAMCLHPSAAAATREGRPLFPTLPPDGVVLVCDLRSD
jgi:hypothetical protein